MNYFLPLSCSIIVSLLACGPSSANRAFAACPLIPRPAKSFRVVRHGGLLAGSRELALKLFETIVFDSKDAAENVFFSPASIWLSLTSTFFGAQKRTKVELAKLLGFTNINKLSLSVEFQKIKQQYSQESIANGDDKLYKKTVLRFADRIFLNNDLQLCPAVIEYLISSGTEADQVIGQVNFINEPEETRNLINYWVGRQTANKITDLLAPGDVDSDTRLVLVSAAYFRGQWTLPFNEKATSYSEFDTRPQDPNAYGTKIMLPMMHIEESFRYLHSKLIDSHIIEMPYVGGSMSLFGILPSFPNITIESVVSSLSAGGAKRLTEEFNKMRLIEIVLSFPKFRIEKALEPKYALEKLGLKKIFYEDVAELRGFTGEDIYVNKFQHKAFVEVTEMGTEAAAATAEICSVPVSQVISSVPPLELKFDRPFIYFIWENNTNSIIFSGVLRNPLRY